MKCLVLYDSVFNNTEKIAQCIQASLQECDLLKVVDCDSKQVIPYDLIFVGSPTRAFTATKALLAFINSLEHNGFKDKKVAVFDTRLQINRHPSMVLRFMVKYFGYADKKLERVVLKKKAQLVSPSGIFFVEDVKGPLKKGECERAAAWAQSIYASLVEV